MTALASRIATPIHLIGLLALSIALLAAMSGHAATVNETASTCAQHYVRIGGEIASTVQIGDDEMTVAFASDGLGTTTFMDRSPYMEFLQRAAATPGAFVVKFDDGTIGLVTSHAFGCDMTELN